MSVSASTGIYYDFIPPGVPVNVDTRGRLRPAEVLCHIRSHLNVSLDQERYQSQLSTPAERKRKDIWWLAPNGENAAEVVEDIARCFLAQGVDWFNAHSDLEKAFAEIERGHDCYIKFYQATYFARYLGNERKYEEYLKQLNQEGQRIGKRT